jgi:hypothetical protein
MEVRENRPQNDILLGNRKNRYVLWTKDEFSNCNYFQIASFFCNHELAVRIFPEHLEVWGGSRMYGIVSEKKLITQYHELSMWESSGIEKYFVKVPKESKWYNWCLKNLYKYHLRETVKESEDLIAKLNLGEEVGFTDFLINGVKEQRFEWNGMRNESDLIKNGLL